MSESSIKNNNAYFVKEGLTLIFIGLILLLATGIQNIKIDGISLLAASLIFLLIGNLFPVLQSCHLEHYNKKNHVYDISPNIYWNDWNAKDYDSDYCKKARKISRLELKTQPQYYPYLSDCLERRIGFDKKFWRCLGYITFFFSAYAFSGEAIIIPVGLLCFLLDIYIMSPKRSYSDFYSDWEEREAYTNHYTALFFFILSCAASIIMLKAQIGSSLDESFILHLSTFIKKYHSLINGLMVGRIIFGIYDVIGSFTTDPASASEERRMKGLLNCMDATLLIALVMLVKIYYDI